MGLSIPAQPTPNSVNGGHYSCSTQSGLMASGIASAAQVWQVRFVSSTKILILKYVKVQASTCTGFAATTIGAPLQLFVGHGSTANGSGGAAVVPTSSGPKLRSSFATSEFNLGGEIRTATTAALTAATGQTLEPIPIGGCMGADNRTLVSTPEMYLFDQRDAGDHPQILANGDTLAITTLNPAATGTWTFCVTWGWVEAVSYS